MNGYGRTPQQLQPLWLQRTLRDASEVAGGYAERHPWQLAAAGAALGALTALLVRRVGGKPARQPRDYSDGG